MPSRTMRLSSARTTRMGMERAYVRRSARGRICLDPADAAVRDDLRDRQHCGRGRARVADLARRLLIGLDERVARVIGVRLAGDLPDNRPGLYDDEQHARMGVPARRAVRVVRDGERSDVRRILRLELEPVGVDVR